jgi:M6 family metalloprotease-like protein
LTVLIFGSHLLAADPDLFEYRTVANAIPARIGKAQAPAARQPGFLGLHVTRAPEGHLTVAELATDSPAVRAGIECGDRLLALDNTSLKDEPTLHELLRTRSAGDTVQLVVMRKDQVHEVKATLAPISRPLAKDRPEAILGVQVAAAKEGEGVVIEQVVTGSPADRSRLRVGEILLKLDDVALTNQDKLDEAVAARKPDDQVTLTMLVADKVMEMKLRLGGEPQGERRQTGFDRRGGGYWTRPTYRLGIICVEYPDAGHNPKISPKAWEEAMFSKGTYTKYNATGQPVYGSLYDYYFEQSYGKLAVEGKAFDYVEVSKKRAEYATGNRTALLTEALDKLLERDKEALKDIDGVFFVYAGERFPAARGSLYWPHRASVYHNGKRWPYFICPEGGPRMQNNSVFCHEFGHLLGLPDLYARPENPGMEGVGVWCAMANQVGNGRPQHFCAWSKEKLGWIQPTVIDPTVRQKLILSPIEDAPKECFKVLVRPDGSEYFLLENRRKKGFDQSLPGEGLLIWRVVGNRPILQESHGVEGPAGPRVFLNAVPYPSPANDAFTLYTTPSTRSQLGGGLPVSITNIRRLPDGRITFHIGYEYY